MDCQDTVGLESKCWLNDGVGNDFVATYIQASEDNTILIFGQFFYKLINAFHINAIDFSDDEALPYACFVCVAVSDDTLNRNFIFRIIHVVAYFHPYFL